MVRKCAWCRRVWCDTKQGWRAAPPSPTAPRRPVTHGICEICFGVVVRRLPPAGGRPFPAA